MFIIESFLFKTKNHKGNPDLLVNIRSYEQIDINNLDSLYLEGAITILYYNEVFLDTGQWDLVDQLYLYFTEALIGVKETGKSVFGFLILLLKFSLSGNNRNMCM
ncbi:MAG: hypothetical protein LIP01_06945 [Tannerellaceae bacterium]|nr:hypothetical protein [Tannerellaceae bacterium]